LLFYIIMTSIDIIILIVIAIGGLVGLMKGFIKQLASTLGLIVGLLVAKALYTSLAERLCPTITHSMTVAQILSFVVIWIAVPLLFTIVASLLTKLMETVSLGWLNRIMGFVLGVFKYILLLSLLICITEFFDSDNAIISKTKKDESVLYYPIKSLAGLFFPAAKHISEQYILNK